MLSNTRQRSTAFDRRFFSLKIIEPKQNETITLPRRTMEVTEIIASG